MAEATQKTANYMAEMVDSMIEMYNELGNDNDEIAILSENFRSVAVRSWFVRSICQGPKDCGKLGWTF